MSAVQVRRLHAGDAGLAIEALRSLREPASSAPVDDAVRRFLSRPENVLIVAFDGGKAAGFLLAYLLDRVDRDRRMACLYEIGVSEAHRRRGAGRALIDELKALCRPAGIRKIWTVTQRSNRAAVRLYESTGGQAGPGGGDVTFVWLGD